MSNLLREFQPKNVEKLRIGMRLNALRFSSEHPEATEEDWINGEGDAELIAGDLLLPSCLGCCKTRFTVLSTTDREYEILSCYDWHFSDPPTYFDESGDRPMTQEEVKLGKQFREDLTNFLRDVWHGGKVQL
jgi:hypothetical protein